MIPVRVRYPTVCPVIMTQLPPESIVAPPAVSSASVTTLQGAALYVGAVLGTGVIALPAIAAKAAGPASLLAWLALVLLSVPLAATFSALGARYPDAGGVSTYVRKAFGPYAAAIVGWCFLFSIPVGGPAAALFAGAYVEAAIGGGNTTVALTAFSILAALSLLNAFGISISGKVQVVLAALLVSLLLAAVCASLPHASLANLHPFAPHGWLAVGTAATFLVWSFAGWEAVTHLAGEFRRPAHDLPRATAIAVVVIGLLYLGVAVATILVLGSRAGTTRAPLAQLLAIGLGGQVKVLAAVAAVLLTAGTMNAYLAGAAKLGAALGRDGALPAWLAHGSHTGGVPRRSLAVIAGSALATMALTEWVHLSVDALVLLTTGLLVLVYVLGSAAALRLLDRNSWAYRSAWLALIFDVALLALTGWYMLWPLGVALCAVLYQYVRHRRSAARP